MAKNISEKEIKSLEEILQEKLFTELVGDNPTSERIHFLYEVVKHLQGAYHDQGIRNWFYRERAQLDRNSPLQYLSPAWKPEEEHAQKVLELAKSLR